MENQVTLKLYNGASDPIALTRDASGTDNPPRTPDSCVLELREVEREQVSGTNGADTLAASRGFRMTGLDYTATIAVDEDELFPLDEWEYDYTRIEPTAFGFVTTAVFTVNLTSISMEKTIDVEVESGPVR